MRVGMERDEYELRRQIEDFYLPKQLVDAIIENGGIPKGSSVQPMGIGFLDVADYTYLSKFLSPQENQAVLNGLYTAFNSVLKRHGGYLNKIEGDSLMFHYGGLIDPNIKDKSEHETVRYIAKELFYTCVELQRVCVLFNQANDRFLYESETDESRRALENAFHIISTLRSSMDLGSSFNALFQIRVRIGANIGEVTIGNFGPDGAKQWDVVGLPVIDAKRMESTAPIGGVRISERLYNVLEETGIVDSYYQRFKKEADALFGYYRDITKEELFRYSTVRLQDKKDARFNTYSVQVNPGLPESIMEQVELLLARGRVGADRILEFIRYYRGNRFVTNAIEDALTSRGVQLRKGYLFKLIYPRKYEALLERCGDDAEHAAELLQQRYSLYQLFERMGAYQDTVKQTRDFSVEEETPFQDSDQYLRHEEQKIMRAYERRKASMIQREYFFNVVFPLVFASLRASILEYQYEIESVEGHLEAV